jgi:hypothetical protein
MAIKDLPFYISISIKIIRLDAFLMAILVLED